jgi:hypothetical protein
MTEAEWLTAREPRPLLDFLYGKTTQRKLRLFACACCRQLGPLLTESQLRHVLPSAEQFADGLLGARERVTSRRNLLVASRSAAASVAWAVYWASSGNAAESVQNAAEAAAEAASQAAREAARATGADEGAAWDSAREPALEAQADLLRHIIGNPFRPLPPKPSSPAVVTHLAEALYAGQDVAFALHDALLESGQSALAEHFREPHHPKGCWALDLLLGKE